jgi:hypothetical protein
MTTREENARRAARSFVAKSPISGTGWLHADTIIATKIPMRRMNINRAA